MKTIGIITYHHYYNYGTMLQALALQEKVEQLGYQAELIDFKQDNSLSRYEMLKLRIKRMPVYIKERKKYRALADSREKIKEKNELFEQFYKTYLHVGKKKYTTTQQLMENPPVYDGYVVGSDQTSNPFVANSPEAFFLPFVENKSKKGSYGPSLAVKSLSDEKEKEYRKKLSNFSFLSCREQDGAQLLSRITQKEVKCVLDPTLLLSAKEWGKYCEFEIPKEPYILVYFLGEKSEHRRAVEKIQKLTNWKIISLPAAYLEMEKLQKEGLTRSIGVSNFRKSHLQNLLSKVHIVPSINQIETNPQMVDEETIQYCKENKIGVEAWSPLGSGACLNNPKIQEIANKYQKSSAQIILRWLLQKGIVILPKSVHENRIKENIDLFNFVLENEDVELINQLNQHKRTGPDPDNFDF